MDEGCSQAVREVFVSLYEKGLIYQGSRITNWCVNCNTALSDIEVEHEDDAGNLWYVRYPVVGEMETYLTIATTRLYYTATALTMAYSMIMLFYFY